MSTKQINQQALINISNIRLNKHIKLVQYYYNKLLNISNEDFLKWFNTNENDYAKYYRKFINILEKNYSNIQNHDKDKINNIGYAYVNLFYLLKKKNIFEQNKEIFTSDILKMCQEVTYKHVLNNSHHPEYWIENIDNNIRTEIYNQMNLIKRDAVISKTKITEMSIEDIIELCCDWMAVSTERHSNIDEWLKLVIDNRWIFTEKNKQEIYRIINYLKIYKIQLERTNAQ